MTPFFSIIIPCYNQAHFLSDCLESLQQQSYTNWEAIVVNDGSTDNTNQVANQFVTKDSRIKLFEKDNGGLSSARNYGLENSNGQRIIFLDSDDFLYPKCLKTILDFSKECDDYDLIQYGYTYVKEDGKTILGHTNAIKKNNIIPDVFKSNLGPCHSICISSTLAKAAGSFDESLKSVEDWDFWIRAVKAGGRQKTILAFLVYYRYSKNSMSRNPFVMFDALKTVIERGPQKDNRITIESSLNKDFDFDTKEVLNTVLIRSVGVGVMQGRIDETITFFKKFTNKPIEKYSPQDFDQMCSYLSFRYWYSRSDIDEVFKIIYPNFILFFKAIGYSDSLTKKALYFIFKRHFFYKNIYRYGKLLGRFFNSMFRFYNEKIMAKL